MQGLLDVLGPGDVISGPGYNDITIPSASTIGVVDVQLLNFQPFGLTDTEFSASLTLNFVKRGTYVITDADGEAQNVFMAGTIVTEYDITATADFGDGRTASASITIKVTPLFRVAYRWQQSILEFDEQGSSRWSSIFPAVTLPNPDMQDCDDSVWVQLSLQYAPCYATDMAVNNFLGHIGSDSSTPEQRAQEGIVLVALD